MIASGYVKNVSIWIKIEQIALMIGLTGVVLLSLVLWNWSAFPHEFRQLFYGGQPAAFFIGFAIMGGVLGTLLFFANLILRRRASVRWRLIMVFLFLSSLPFLGAFL